MTARYCVRRRSAGLTLAPAVDGNGGEPVVSDEVALGVAIWYVAFGVRVNVKLREAEVDHVDQLVVRRQTDDTVAQLDVSVQEAARVHELKARYLWTCTSICQGDVDGWMSAAMRKMGRY